MTCTVLHFWRFSLLKWAVDWKVSASLFRARRRPKVGQFWWELIESVRRSAYQFSGDIFIRRPQGFTHIPPHDPHTRYARSKAIMNQITYLAHLYLANDFSDLAVGSMAGQPSLHSSLSHAQVPQVIGIDLRYANYATMKSPCQTYRFGPDQMPKPFSRYH